MKVTDLAKFSGKAGSHPHGQLPAKRKRLKIRQVNPCLSRHRRHRRRHLRSCQS